MATNHRISNILLGQAGGSEFGVIGNIKEFVSWFYDRYGYVLRAPVAYIKAAYMGGQSQHKLDFMANGYLVLCIDRLVFFSKMPKFIIEIPISAINKNLMFVEAKGFTRLALTARDKEKFLEILEQTDISKEGKKILQNLPEETAALARQRYSKTDINAFIESVINFAQIIKKRTLQIPYMSYWGLEKPKFFLGITSPGLDEFIYAWAKLTLKA
ncbi:MAG: hypothetical protein QW063_03045 [Candidatus Nanoarchaeia archaeon]